MFTKLIVKNFRSLVSLDVDFQNKQSFKNAVIIFGENGMGKSNVISAFAALSQLLQTMDVRDMLEQLLLDSDLNQKNAIRNGFIDGFKKTFPTVEMLAEEFRTVDASGPTELEYHFIIDGKKGSYTIALDNGEIIHEKLEYTLEKNKGVYFNLSKETFKINAKIFNGAEMFEDVSQSVKKFWGKHSLLSIIIHEMHDKSREYVNQELSDNFNKVLDSFSRISYITRRANCQKSMIVGGKYALQNGYVDGRIKKNDELKLDAMEQLLTILFRGVNENNKKLFYDRVIKEDYIEYKLQIVKKIAGKERTLSFAQESTGNHQILEILPYLLATMDGGVVFVDEIDTGIHGLLIKHLLDSILPHVKGQLILTTHNTMLMEVDNAKDFVYILSETSDGNKALKCVSKEKRIAVNNNIRTLYLSEAFSGLPSMNAFDVTAMEEIISSAE